MSLRKEFVLKVLAKEAPVAELCRRYRISRKTGYKWLARFKAKGMDGLLDESRRPHASPLETTSERAREIVELRRSHARWGPKKLQRLLARQHGEDAPSTSTVTRVLERHGCIKRRRRRPSPKRLPQGRPAPLVAQPNDLWTVDFKGWWRTADGAKCEPLTVRDAHSRFVLGIRLLPDTSGATVKREFEYLFHEYGVPRAIHTDNGSPFASPTALNGLTKLSAWWVSLGIQLIRSRPGCPQDNGAHERMHADIQREIRAHVAESRLIQQRACDEWRVEFNHVRPHEALAMMTPSDVYRPSRRRAIVQTGAFPVDCDRRTVDARGWISWNAQRIYVTTALSGQVVGLVRVQHLVSVWLYAMLLGTFRYGHTVDSVEPTALELSPGAELSPGDTSDLSPGDTPDLLPDQTPGDSSTPVLPASRRADSNGELITATQRT